jgi:hypothetical protein
MSSPQHNNSQEGTTMIDEGFNIACGIGGFGAYHFDHPP